MDSSLHPGITSIIEQQASILHDRLFKQDLHIQAILFVSRHQAGPPRIVAHYPFIPQGGEFKDETLDHENDEASRGSEEENGNRLGACRSQSPNRHRLPDRIVTENWILPAEDDTTKERTDASSEELAALAQHAGETPKLSLAMTQPQIARTVLAPTQDLKKFPSTTSSNIIFGMNKDTLAKLLAPANMNIWHCKKFETRLARRLFIGCPVFCRLQEQYVSLTTKRGDEFVAETNIDEKGDERGTLEHEFRAESWPLDGQRRDENKEQINDISNRDSYDEADTGGNADVIGSEASFLEISRGQTVAEPLPIRNPNTAGEHSEQDTATESPSYDHQPHSLQSTISSASACSEAERKNNPLLLFNVVVVINPPPWTYHKCVEISFDHVVRPLAMWLLRAQEREEWVDKQIRKIDYMSVQKQRSFPASPVGMPSSAHGDISFEFMSRLERLLKDLVQGLQREQVVHLSLKNRQDILSIRIPQVMSSAYLPQPLTQHIQRQARPTVNSANLVACGSAGLRSPFPEYSNGVRRQNSQRDLVKSLDLLDELGIETNEPLAISRHSALVLLEDRDVLVSQLQPGTLTRNSRSNDKCDLTPLRATPIAKPLSYFVKNLTFRRTLFQLTQSPQPSASTIATKSRSVKAPIAPAMPGFEVQDVQLLACLLIRLGAARATLPIHASNTYTVSPTAPIESFEAHERQWQRRFGLADSDDLRPRLGELLGRLSGYSSRAFSTVGKYDETNGSSRNSRGARPWASMIPRKSEKFVYMDMLSWLVARNWVTQIRTFAWVWVSREVKQEVDKTMRAEKSTSDQVADTPRDDAVAEAGQDNPAESKPRLSWLSPLRSASRPVSAAGSTGSTRTAVRAPASTISRKSSQDTLSRMPTPGPQDYDELLHSPSLIPSPRTASAVEQQWIAYIGERLEDTDARRLWPDIVRYFDGRHAVEEIAAIEGWKRAVLASVFKKLMVEGVVKTVRHW